MLKLGLAILRFSDHWSKEFGYLQKQHFPKNLVKIKQNLELFILSVNKNLHTNSELNIVTELNLKLKQSLKFLSL